MIAAGLPFQALSPCGREAQSIAFFNTPDTDRLYSGVTNRIAFASRIRLFNSVTLAGGFCSSSWLNGGMPSSSNVSTVASFGASSTAARSAARLYDPLRRLPAIPRIRIGVFNCDPSSHFLYGVVSSFSSVSTTNTASSLAGSVLLAFSLTLCRSPGISEKLCPAR